MRLRKRESTEWEHDDETEAMEILGGWGVQALPALMPLPVLASAFLRALLTLSLRSLIVKTVGISACGFSPWYAYLHP